MDDHTVGEEKISSGNWQFSKTNVFASLKVVNELIDLSVNCEEYVLLIKVFERKIVLFFYLTDSSANSLTLPLMSF